MASLTHMERAVPCSVQRSTAVASKQMQMAAPRMAFAKAPAFSAAVKNVLAQQPRSVIAKVRAPQLNTLNQ